MLCLIQFNKGKIKIWETNRCYNLEEAAEETRKYKKLKAAYEEASKKAAPNLDERKEKRIAIGISKLGTSTSVCLGAYALALDYLDKKNLYKELV